MDAQWARCSRCTWAPSRAYSSPCPTGSSRTWPFGFLRSFRTRSKGQKRRPRRDRGGAPDPGVRRITRFDPTPFASQVAGEVPNFDPLEYLPRRDVVRTDLFIHFALTAAQEALGDSKLRVEGQSDRVGVSVGSSVGGLPLLLRSYDQFLVEGPDAISPYALPGFLPNMAAGWISMNTGARGPIASPATACAAGNQAIGDAFRAIQRGDADAMLAGGAAPRCPSLHVWGLWSPPAPSRQEPPPR